MENRLSQRAVWAEGQPISDLMARALANPDLISLAAGFVDPQTLPVEPTRGALAELLEQPHLARAALQYGTTLGYPPLREALLEQTHAQDGGLARRETDIDQVVVTAGSNQLLHLIADTLLDPGDIVLTAAPTYLVFLGTLNNVGARPFSVASDEHGMIPEALIETLEHLQAGGLLPRLKAIYLVPYYDNPSGVSMPAERRAAVVEIARRWSTRHKIYVIADNAYRELRYEGENTPSTYCYDRADGLVVEAGTFSKSFSPGIRVGWGILPRDLIDPICNQKGNIDFGSPNFSQHLVHAMLRSGQFEPHVEQLRTAYRVKMQAMLEAAEQHLGPIPGVRWLYPQGGLYVWLELPEGLDAGPQGTLFDLAVEEGVLYVPGQYCYANEGQAVCANRIRLSFGVQSVEGIDRGMAALGAAIRKALCHGERPEIAELQK